VPALCAAALLPSSTKHLLSLALPQGHAPIRLESVEPAAYSSSGSGRSNLQDAPAIGYFGVSAN